MSSVADIIKLASEFEKKSTKRIPPVDSDAVSVLSRRMGQYYMYREIPISQITGNTEVWSNVKLEKVRKAMAEGKPIEPIILALRDNGEFSIVDGIHRTAVAKELGYSYMPAFVEKKISD